MITLRPVQRIEARQFVLDHHRHHGSVLGFLWVHGLAGEGGALVGIAVVGRSGARALQNGVTMEVARLCTDREPNGCSMPSGAARRAAIAKGHRRGLTISLRARPALRCVPLAGGSSGAYLVAAGIRPLGRALTSTQPRTSQPTDGAIGRHSNRRNAAVYSPFWGYRNCHLELHPQISPRMRRTLTPPYGTCETKSPTNDAILRIPDEVR